MNIQPWLVLIAGASITCAVIAFVHWHRRRAREIAALTEAATLAITSALQWHDRVDG